MNRQITTEELKELDNIESNYLIIELSYSNTIVLSFREGMKLLNTLEKAESYDSSDYKNPFIAPLKIKLETTLIGASEYKKLKMYKLLGVTNINE